jgi:hypothetical protein
MQRHTRGDEMNREKAIEMMRKIRAQAESEANIGNLEAAALYGNKLQALMMKFDVELSDIEWEAEKKDIRSRLWMCPQFLDDQKWVRAMVAMVGETNFCRGCMVDTPGIYFFVGLEMNVEAAVQIADYLFSLISRAGQKHLKEWSLNTLNYTSVDGTKITGFPFFEVDGDYTDFAIGFIVRYRSRLKEEENETVLSQCTLIRREEGLQIVDKFMKDKEAGTSEENHSIKDPFGYFDGMNEADKIVMPKNRKRQIGEEKHEGL